MTMKGCFFHVLKNLKERVAKVGITERYSNQLALQCKMILAQHHAKKYFAKLAENISEDIKILLDQFEDAYIGRLQRRGNGRRIPLCALSMWNLYLLTMNNEDRTNNCSASH